jgi:hypothetical protein
MSAFTLEISLESDTAFSMGAGISGMVDSEIQHDDNGLPFISGRTLKGLLVNECSEILYALNDAQNWKDAAQSLFGSRGDMDVLSGLSIGDATLAPDLVNQILCDELTRQEVLDALTSIRYQTAMSEQGAPKDESLRATRTLISGLIFYAPFSLPDDNLQARSLLAACVLSLRHAGLGRRRGKGKIKVGITDRPLDLEKFAATQSHDLTRDWFGQFKQEVTR